MRKMSESRLNFSKCVENSEKQGEIESFQLKINTITENQNVSQKKNLNADENFDAIEQSIGSLGKWQIVTALLLFLVKFPSAWHQLAIVFLAPPVNFTCNLPDNNTEKCSPFCKEYEFDRSIFIETIITQWNLVCERAHLANWIQTNVMLGILTGSLLFGYLSDKYGRKGPLVIALIIQVTSGVACAFSPSLLIFFILKFLSTLATAGTIVISFVLVTEIVGSKWRAVVGVLFHLPFSIGYLLLTLFAYYIRHWKYLQIIISLPSIILISYYWLLPESPRWLIVTGKPKKATIILEKAAKRNKMSTEGISYIVNKAIELKNTNNIEPKSTGKFIDLIRTPNLRLKTLVICYCWFVDGLCFFGVAQYLAQAKGDIFLNVIVSAIVQIPGIISTIYLIEVWGRKTTEISFSTLSGISCIAVILIPENLIWIRTSLSVIGIFGFTISGVTLFTYSSELLPTVVRNVGIGLGVMCARIGSMFSPFIATLVQVNPSIPPFIFGIMQFSAALFCLLLPETLGTVLPDTIEDGEKSGKKSGKKSNCDGAAN